MARVAQNSNGANGTSVTVALTLSGTDRLLYVAVSHSAAQSITTVAVGANTVFEAGVDESRRIHGPGTFSTAHALEVFRVFDTDLPANGSVNVVVSTGGTAALVAQVVQYADADQTTGHRGTPVTLGTSTGTAWDLTSIPNDAGDVETLGFAFMRHTGSTNTPDADNPELLSEVNSGTSPAANGEVGVTLTDTASRDTLGGDWSNSFGTGAWGASIIPAAGGGAELDAQPGSFTVDGKPLGAVIVAVLEPGVVSLVGLAVFGVVAQQLAPGSIAVTGVSLTGVESGGQAINAEPGSFTVDGKPLGAVISAVLEPGVIQLTGLNVVAGFGARLVPGVVSLSGQQSVSAQAAVLAPGVLVVTGIPAGTGIQGLTQSIILEPGVFLILGAQTRGYLEVQVALDCTVGGPAANSYVCLVDAAAMLSQHLDAAEWAAADVEIQQMALIMATARLEAEDYDGKPTTTTQSLQWPRWGTCDRNGVAYPSDAIPGIVQRATAELALALLKQPDLLGDTGLEPFAHVAAGSLSVTPRASWLAGTLPAQVRRLLQPVRLGGRGRVWRA